MKFNSLESTRRQRPKENTSGLTQGEEERAVSEREGGRKSERERRRLQLAIGKK